MKRFGRGRVPSSTAPEQVVFVIKSVEVVKNGAQ